VTRTVSASQIENIDLLQALAVLGGIIVLGLIIKQAATGWTLKSAVKELERKR